jgi:hypothetical protein
MSHFNAIKEELSKLKNIFFLWGNTARKTTR